MNVQSQVAKLESLLGRILTNAAKPKASRTALVSGPPAAVRAPAPSPAPAPARMMAAPQPPRAVAEPPAAPPALVELPEPEAIHADAPPLSTAHNEPPQAEAPAEIEELDMMDAEIVEIAATAAVVEEEPVPESAPRPAIAAESAEAYPDPIKTPPPESGRQAVTASATTGYSVEPEISEATEADLGGSSDVDSLLEADLSATSISMPPDRGPTMSQLGETVELEGAEAPDATLELDAPVSSTEQQDEPDALELSLPRREFSGSYDADLAPPADAGADLERHRQRGQERAPSAAPVSMPSPLSSPVSIAAETVPAAPVVVERPIIEAHAYPAEIVVAKAPAMPRTFLEMLDASLGL